MKNKKLISSYLTLVRNEFKGYGAKSFLSDVISGITVGAVALPLALAFGAASVPSEFASIGIPAGLITAILAGIITGLLGGASFQISGPTGTMSVILCALVYGEYGFTGMFAAGFLAGIIRLLAGIFHLGKLIRFIPKPVVTGFTAGIALIIALGQIGNFFGVSLGGVTTVEKIVYFFENCLADISLSAVICSVAVILLMVFYPKKIAKYIPGSLGALIVATAVTAIFKIDVAVIGDIPRAIVNTVHLRFGDLSIGMLIDVAGPAFSIAMLCMIETLLCGSCAANMKKEPFDPNVELVAQGVANVVIAFFGGVPSTAALARTSVAIRAGGKTRVAGVFHSLFLVACMFVLSDLISLVPFAALAGVLIVTAVRMNDWAQIKLYCKGRVWSAVAQFLITAVATVLLDLTYAIMIGVILAFILLVCNLIKAEASFGKLRVETECSGGILTAKIIGNCFFANAGALAAAIEGIGDYTTAIIDMSEVTYADFTASEAIGKVAAELSEEGKSVTIIGVRPSVEKAFISAGFGGCYGI